MVQWRPKQSLDTESTKSLVHASFDMSRVDYCNSALVGLPKSTTDWLRRVLNSAARLVTGRGKFDCGYLIGVTATFTGCVFPSEWVQAGCDRDNIRLLSTWSTATHLSLTSPLCQSSSSDGTTTSAQYVRPSLSLVRRSGTRCPSTFETRRSVYKVRDDVAVEKIPVYWAN